MSKLVGNNAGGNANGCGGILKRGTEFEGQNGATTRPGKKQTSGMGGVGWAQRAETIDQLTDQGVDGNQALGFEFAQGYMDGPLFRRDGAQTIDGKIDALADAHAGIT